MKIWVDDRRPAPEGWRWVTNVDEAKIILNTRHALSRTRGFLGVEILDLDHDAGRWRHLGDYIDILNWLEAKQNIEGWKIDFPIRLHTMNPVGRKNMQAIIKKNGWKEVF